MQELMTIHTMNNHVVLLQGYQKSNNFSKLELWIWIASNKGSNPTCARCKQIIGMIDSLISTFVCHETHHTTKQSKIGFVDPF